MSRVKATVNRYLNPSFKLKLIELAIKLYQEFWNNMNCLIFTEFQMLACESAFHSWNSKRMSYGPKAFKKVFAICYIFKFSEKLQNIFEIQWKKHGVAVYTFFFYVKLATFQIWRQTPNKLSLAFKRHPKDLRFRYLLYKVDALRRVDESLHEDVQKLFLVLA